MANYKRLSYGVRLLCVLIVVAGAASVQDFDDSYYDQRQTSPDNFAGNIRNIIIAVVPITDTDSEVNDKDRLGEFNEIQNPEPALQISLLKSDARESNAQASENPKEPLKDVTLNPKTRELENEFDQKRKIETNLNKMLMDMLIPFIRTRKTQHEI